MKSLKVKSSDVTGDLGAMKNQLGAVIKELSAFAGRIEDLEQQDLANGHSCSFIYNQRLQDLKARLQAGRDPTKPVIFLTRMIVECLSKGPMSEKDIKNAVLDRCKDVGIKSSNRGLIAGTGIDVATVCGVLAALGALEQIDSSMLATSTTGRSDTNDATAGEAHRSTTSSGNLNVTSSSGSCPEAITGPGAELYALLTERWQPRLAEYIQEAQKSKLAGETSTAAEGSATASAPTAAVLAAGPASSTAAGAAGAAVGPPSSSSSALPGASSLAHIRQPPPSAAAPPPAPLPTPSSSAPQAPAAPAQPVAYYPIFSQGSALARRVTPPGSSAPPTLPGAAALSAPVRTAPSMQPAGTVPVPAVPAGRVLPAASVRMPALLPNEQLAVSAVAALDGPPPMQPSTGSINSNSSDVSSDVALPPSVLPNNPVNSTLPRPPLGPNNLATYGALGSSTMPGFRPALGSAGSQGHLPAAPNNFLSASAAAQAGGVSGSSSAALPAFSGLPAPAGPAGGVHTEGTYTSILSASGTSIAIPTPNALTAAADAAGKTSKTKAPKPPKPPGEKKPVKRPISKGSDLAAAAAAPTGSSAAVASAAPKPRKPPATQKLWRIREVFMPYVREMMAVANNSSISTSSSGGVSSSAASAATAHATQHNKNETPISRPNLALQLVLQPARIHAYAEADFAHQRALELEERLVRRLAGQCNIPLKSSCYRTGTTYLSADPEIMTRTISSRFVRTSSQMPAYYSASRSNVSKQTSANVSDTASEDPARDSVASNSVAEPSFALYEDGVNMTSAYLLDKVRRTKRQRGECLYGSIVLPPSLTATASVAAARNAAAASVGVYSASHVHALAAVCNKTAEYYWAASATSSGSPRSAQKTKKTPASASKGQAEPITMAQYAQNLHLGIGGAPVVLSSCSDGSGITAHTLRRYAQPLHLTGANLPMLDPAKASTIFAAATGGAHSSSSSGRTNFGASNNGSEVLRIPDLSLCTREIAWSEIANEFSVLPAPVDEPGSLPGSISTATLSASATSEAVSDGTKKRKYLQNHGKPTPVVAGTLHDAAQKLASIEVLAPQCREVEPVWQLVQQRRMGDQNNNSNSSSSSSNNAGQSSDSEDTSDEAVGARHEAVLKKMRDRWNLLQQLKNEAAFGISGPPPGEGELLRPGGSYRGGGYGYYAGRSASGVFASAATLPAMQEGAEAGVVLQLGSPNGAGRFQNLSPRKRGLASAHAKRRGRPPKISKTSHHAHVHAHAQQAAALQATAAAAVAAAQSAMSAGQSGEVGSNGSAVEMESDGTDSDT